MQTLPAARHTRTTTLLLFQLGGGAMRAAAAASGSRGFSWRPRFRTASPVSAAVAATTGRGGGSSRSDSRPSSRPGRGAGAGGDGSSSSSSRPWAQQGGSSRAPPRPPRQEQQREQQREQRGSRPPGRQQQQLAWRRSESDRSGGGADWRGQQQQRRRRDDEEDGYDDEDGGGGGARGSYDTDEYGEFPYPARASKASFMDSLFGEPLYGVAPVLAALTAGIRRPHALLVQEGLDPAARKDARALTDIKRLAEAAGAAVRGVSKHELNMLCGNRPHQGLILDASPLPWRTLEALPAVEELQAQAADTSSSSSGVSQPVWLALDEVMDPQNLGAMLRSAYCLGVTGVLACSRNCSPLTPVVSKASAGAAELMTLHSCRSMPRTLADAAEKGWAVVGAAAESAAVPLAEFKVDRPTIIVMGNEGYGLRSMVKRCCTQLVQIEMAPGGGAARQQQQLVDSLNVSVATGILLHHMLTAAQGRQQ